MEPNLQRKNSKNAQILYGFTILCRHTDNVYFHQQLTQFNASSGHQYLIRNVCKCREVGFGIFQLGLFHLRNKQAFKL